MMKKVRNKGTGKAYLSSIALLATLTPNLVLSQESGQSEAQEEVMEMVLVTARHREEDLKDVPVSISVVDEDFIEQLGARTLQDLEKVVPNFKMSKEARPEITIRGRKNNAQTIGVEAGVGVYVNGVYTSRIGTNVDLMEVEQVEVLRGPQGTLYGKNTISGAINIRIKKPSDELKGGIATSLGNYGREDVRGFVEGGLTDTLATRLSVSHIKWDGYQTNVFTGKPRGGNDSLSGNLQLNYLPTDALSIELMMEYRDQERLHTMHRRFSDQSRGDQAANMAEIMRLAEITEPLPLGKIDKGAEDADRYYFGISKGLSLTIDYTMGNDYTLTSISAWRNQEGGLEGQDNDFFPHFGMLLDALEDQEGLTQELRITSPGGQRIDWLAGLYYDKQEMASKWTLTPSDIGIAGESGQLLVYGVDTTPGSNPATVDTESIAAYASMDIHFTDALTLTLGARYTEEDKSATFQQSLGGTCIVGASDRADDTTKGVVTLLLAGSLVPGFNTACLYPQYDEDDLSFDTDSFDPAISLGYTFSDEVSAYLKVSTGYKSGGFNIDFFRPEGDAITEGILGALVPGELFTPGYRDEIPHTLTFEDEEVLSYEAGLKTALLENRLIINLAVFNSLYENMQERAEIEGSEIVANIAEADVYGAELDMTWAVNANWYLVGAYGYVKTEYTDYPEIDSDGTIDNRRGQEFGPAPWTASFAANYSTAITDLGSIRARLAYTQTADRPEILDTRVTWSSPEEAFVVALWADNIFDERDVGYGVGRIFGLEYGIVASIPPRIYGVDFKYKF